MTVRPFDKEVHASILSQWLLTHTGSTMALSALPRTGFIAYKGDIPVATAFLRLSEGDLGIFDGLCTNPRCTSEERDAALDAVTVEVIKTAKELGLKGIIAWSEDKNTLMRASRHGFAKQHQTVIALSLS